jgi:hypothetical protein
MENPEMYPTPKETPAPLKEKSIPFEITRFFLALKITLDTKPQLLKYMKDQIYTDVENLYLRLTDVEVKDFLKAGK